jgi:O-antigen/teichoic acid export membrane protein
MRVKNTIMNITTGITSTLITTIASFILRTIFIQKLGSEYLGINGLLTNILSMLSLAELGIGTAIGFSLYKPLNISDKSKIKSLMFFYKKAYLMIGIFVLVMGLILIPFMPFFVKDIGLYNDFYLIYFLYLINTAYSYLFSYKRTIIVSDQKGYYLTNKTMIFKIVTTILQGAYLFIANNFIIYLLIQFVMGVIENLVVNKMINKIYPYLKEKDALQLEQSEKKAIYKNIKAMVYHKIGDYCINGTDNIIMSKYISIATVGIYSNYSMIITCVNSFLVTIFNSAGAAFGNLISSETKEMVYEKFKTFDFLAFWLFGFASLSFFFLLNPFIQLWLGDDYLIDTIVVLVVIVNFYFTSMRVPLGIVKSSAGIYDQDKYIPLIQALVNLVVSIVCVKVWGLMGIFVGTLSSSVLVVFAARPYFVYKYVFKRPFFEYFVEFFKYFFIVIAEALLIYTIFSNIYLADLRLYFIFKIMVLCLVPNIINFLIFRKDKNFLELKEILINTVRRWKNGKQS